MREVKPASELRDRVPWPLPRHPAAPCPSFYPNYGARSLAPDFWGGDTTLSGSGPYIPRRSSPLNETIECEASFSITDLLTKPKEHQNISLVALHCVVTVEKTQITNPT